MYDQRGEDAVPFAHFLGSENGQPVTPQVLTDLGLYRSLAVPLYGGEYDEATIHILLSQLAFRQSVMRTVYKFPRWIRREQPSLLREHVEMVAHIERC